MREYANFVVRILYKKIRWIKYLKIQCIGLVTITVIYQLDKLY